MYGRKSLRSQLVVIFVLLLAALTGILSLSVGRISVVQIERDIGEGLAELAFHMGDKFDRGMWARTGEVAVLTEMDTLRNPADPAAIRRILARLQESIPVFSWVGFLDPSGKVVAATGDVLAGVNISQRPVYAEGIKGRFVGDVHEAVMLAKLLPNPSGEPLRFVDVSYQVRNDAGSVVGVVAAHLSWAWAREIEQSLISVVQKRRGVDLFIVGADGTVLLGPAGRAPLGKLDLRAIGEAKAKRGGWSVETWPDGKGYLTGYSLQRGFETFPGFGWTILARQSVEDAHEPVRRIQRLIILIGIGLAVAFSAVTWAASGLVSKPLRRIADAADQLSEGKRDDLPLIGGSSEVTRLSSSLRHLVATLTSTERRMVHMEQLASHDRLTGLPNRLALEVHLEHLAPEARRRGGVLVCLYMDLDGFKPINDTLGHQAGDQVLKGVADRLRDCLRGGDIVVRLGGDEFLMLVPASAETWHQEAAAVADRVISALATPFDLDGRSAKVGCSIGVAAWPRDGEDVHGVIHLADEALYSAKAAGKNRAAFHAMPV